MIWPFQRHCQHETLLAYHDNELPPAKRTKVANHLAGCAQCREESLQMARDLNMVNSLFSLSDALDHAGARAELLATVSALDGGEVEDLDRQVAAELEVFLGAHVATLVRDYKDTIHDRQRLVTEVDSLLTAFLGREAACVLANRILLEGRSSHA